MHGTAGKRHRFNRPVAGHIADVDRAALIPLGGAAGNDQRHAQSARRFQRHGNALCFHGQHKINVFVVILPRNHVAHVGHQFGVSQNIRKIQETARQHAGGGRKHLADALHERPVLAFHADGTIAHAARRAGQGLHADQIHFLVDVRQHRRILADGGLGGRKQLAKIRKGKNAVRLGSQNPSHHGQTLGAFHLLHRWHPPCSPVHPALYYTAALRIFPLFF